MGLQSIEPFGFMDSNLNLIEHKKYIIFGESKEITFTFAGYEANDITNAQERAYNEFIDNSLDYITLIELKYIKIYLMMEWCLISKWFLI